MVELPHEIIEELRVRLEVSVADCARIAALIELDEIARQLRELEHAITKGKR